mgnify:CR=1 FL=1
MTVKESTMTISESTQIPFGGGHLTLEEANQILNHLPLEVSFIDKNDEIKYFNQRSKTGDMMFVRTAEDIGKTVYEAHPPKSQEMVKQLVKDLKSRRRTSESMWYRTKDGSKYIYITFKGVFNEEGEYLGIMEYVQDIQPFFNLPSEMKFGLSKIED